MEVFLITLQSVATMLLYAVPGFVLTKTKILKEKEIHTIVLVLLYGCQTCLMINSFLNLTFSVTILLRFLLTLILALCIMGVFFAGSYFLCRKRFQEPPVRIYAIAGCIGNVGFFGLPLLESLFGNGSDMIVYIVPFSIALNVFSWSVGAAVIAQDKSYASWKKALLNPPTICAFVGFLIFVLQIPLPAFLGQAISTLAHLATPLCLIVLGCRLGLIGVKTIFTQKSAYLVIAEKQILMPLLVFFLGHLLGMDDTLLMTICVLCACPCASMTLNFAELLKAGEDTAAVQLLLSTLLSIITIPLMMSFISSLL